MFTFITRRATTDDLAGLVTLWQTVGLPVAELEKHFTDFQVAIDHNGRLSGAIGMEVVEHEGRLHSEAYIDFAFTDTLRPLLWKRVETLAQNLGLFRLWTLERAPYWKKEVGFTEADAAKREKLPESFGPRAEPWLTLQLREETALPEFIDKQFAMFRETERAESERMLQQAKTLKIIVTIIAVLLFVFVLFGGIFLLRNVHPHSP
jgi:N-acetylglutamate synthase-like GNAT family acetyltransferase